MGIWAGLAVSVLWGASVADYPSIQAALDAHPGVVLTVPAGEHVIDRAILITLDGAGLAGPGRIVQTDPAQAILRVEGAKDVRIEGLTLTRAAGAETGGEPGLRLDNTTRARVSGLRVVDNWSQAGAIEVRGSRDATIRDCTVLNYKRIAVDDRTASPLYGYAFRCIDGTGILVDASVGTVLSGNRIVEERLLPTREQQAAHGLGELTAGREASKPGGALARGVFERGRVDNWHQGSAVLVTGPTVSRHTRITDNHIENAAQGIDLHSDYAVVANNTVNHGMMGIKATHGCRGLIITGNLLTHIDLWGILLNPGAGSHAATPEAGEAPARAANVDAGTIIAQNIISDYGRGHEYWNWGGKAEDGGSSYAIALLEGQLPENPPLRDVLVQGNLVYDTGRDAAPPELPRHRFAIFVGAWKDGAPAQDNAARDLRIVDNVFHPGRDGVSNVPLE